MTAAERATERAGNGPAPGEHSGEIDERRNEEPRAHASDPPPPDDRDVPHAADRSPSSAYSSPHLTEKGNGERLAHRFGHELRHVVERRQWLAWDGRRWHRNANAAMVRAKLVVEQLYREAADLAERAASDPNRYSDLAKAVLKWAASSSTARALKAMLTLAQSEVPVAAVPDAFDRDPFAFNVLNGTIDLRTGRLRPHRPEDMLTMLAPTAYAPNARAPQWEHFLKRVLPDVEIRAFMQRYIGYALTGDVSEQVLAFAHGTGANGKSVLIDVMLEIVGDYGLRAATDLVLAKRSESHPTELADLEGKRLVVASEIDRGRAWSEATLKRLTGDTTITARRMKVDFYTFPATFKLVIAANTRPKVIGTDHGIWRRMQLVPFGVTIPETERDRQLVPKLLAEREGILAWAMAGCLAWQRDGLETPTAVAEATAGYRADQDELGYWIAEECIVVDDAWATTAELYKSYEKWCERTRRPAWTRDTFRECLIERDGIVEHRRTQGRGLKGIALRPRGPGYDA
jgi:putative DNA primase/helicase